MTYDKIKSGIATISTQVIIAAIACVGSIFAAYLTANTQIAVVTERENNHYLEVKGSLDRQTVVLDKLSSSVEEIRKNVK